MAKRRGRIDLVGKHEERLQQRVLADKLQQVVRIVRLERLKLIDEQRRQDDME